MRIRSLSLLLCSLLVACSGDAGHDVRLAPPQVLATPAGQGSAEPNLTLAPGGRVLVSWLEPAADSSVAMRFAALTDTVWSEAGEITRGDSLFVNWADFPSLLALRGGDIVAHWLQRSGGGKYAYDVRISRSRDGGVTWGPSSILHTDRSAAEHGFVALWPEGDSEVGATWLDGRQADSAMMLMHASLGRDGVTGERALDARVCDCCQTSAAVTSSGPVVVYRDRTPDEIRDIAIVRLIGGNWTEPRAVHDDRWHIEGCPVNGPAVAADGDRVAVAWFTAPGDSARVLVAFSTDAGATFSPPVRVDGGTPAGRVGVVLDGAGGAFVSWIERTGQEAAEVHARHVSFSGRLGETTTVATSSAARASGFPRMVRDGDRLIFAWTAPGTPSTIRLATARLLRP